MKLKFKPDYSIEWIVVKNVKELQAFLNWTKHKCEVKYD